MSRSEANHLQDGFCFSQNREWLILNMAGLEREEFRVLYLNNQNQLIAGETLFTGTINRTEVHPREVIKRALYHNAAAVVLAHNHPSGEVTPSKADRLITERLVQALGLVDIRVPDHLIVGGRMCNRITAHAQPSDYHLVRASPRHPANASRHAKKIRRPAHCSRTRQTENRGGPSGVPIL